MLLLCKSCTSDPGESENDKIDAELRKEGNTFRKQIVLVLLGKHINYSGSMAILFTTTATIGTSNSGKTTILKQIFSLT